MSKLQKILAVVQTPAELQWLYGQVKRRANVKYYVLLVGDAITEYSLTNNSDSANLHFLFLHDLGIDDEAVWRQFYLVKDEFKKDTGQNLDEQLHTVTQIDFESSFSDMAYLQAVIKAALNRVEPSEILIPPLFVWRPETVFYVKNLQSVLSEAARRRKIKRRLPMSSRLFFLVNPVNAALRQLWLGLLLVIWDALRILKHFTKKTLALEDWQNAVLIVNAAHDLPRQFDLSVFAAKNKQKCVVWNWQTGNIETLENFLADRKMGKLSDEVIARQSFPVSATKLVKKYFAKTYCSPLRSQSSNELKNLSDLMETRGLAGEKLLNWRRVAYTARTAAKGCDVLKALQPKMVVASDFTDISRAISIAARHHNIPILATAHGINMYTESMQGTFALGNVHCFFGANEGHLIEDDLPQAETVRLVAHDNLKKTVRVENDSVGTGKQRIFIVTSLLSCSFPNWTNEIFVRWTDYGEMLRALLTELSSYAAIIEVVIKSHPLLDDHKMYDRLQADFPDLLVKHWREPIDLSHMIPSDLIVLYNCISTLTFAAIEQGLPVLGFWGALTPLAQRNLVINQLYGTDDVSRLAEMILEIARSADGETAQKAREQARQLLNRFVEPTNLGLTEAVELTLDIKNESKLQTSNYI